RSTLGSLKNLIEGDYPPPIDSVRLHDDDDRATPIFAGLPGKRNYCVDGEPTLFGQALIDCLRKFGGKPLDLGSGLQWAVTPASLIYYMKAHVKLSNLKYSTDQGCQLFGIQDDDPLLYLEGPPKAEIALQVA